MHDFIITSYFFKTNTVNRRRHSTEVCVAKLFAETDSFEYLCTTIRTYGAYTHFAHYLKQSLANRFYIIALGCVVVKLYFLAFHKVVYNGECHVRVECTCSESEQKGCVFCFTYFSAFHNDCGLYPLAYRNKIMMNCRNCKQRRYRSMASVNVAVGKNYVVYAVIHRFFCFQA